MIEGWEKGLLDMCVGEKRKLVVLSDMVMLRSRCPLVHLLEQSNLINDAPFPIFDGIVGGFGSESFNKITPGATLVSKLSY